MCYRVDVYKKIICNIFAVTIVDWEAVVKLSDDFNGADLRNVCTEAGQSLQHIIFVIIVIVDGNRFWF